MNVNFKVLRKDTAEYASEDEGTSGYGIILVLALWYCVLNCDA